MVSEKKHRVEIYLEYTDDFFDVIQNDLYEVFKKERGDLNYVSWLEKKVSKIIGK